MARSILWNLAGLMVAGVLVAAPPKRPAAPRAAAGVVTVVISHHVFLPADVTVSPGGSVRWVNQDAVAHTATSDLPAGADGYFDTLDIPPGESRTAVFPKGGRVLKYHCKYHDMHGSVRVGP